MLRITGYVMKLRADRGVRRHGGDHHDAGLGILVTYGKFMLEFYSASHPLGVLLRRLRASSGRAMFAAAEL
jgi:hypothetical protein